jgi:hypothetical protein
MAEEIAIQKAKRCANTNPRRMNKLSRYRHTGDKGERTYSSYSFLTSALDGVSGQRHGPVLN